MSIQTIKDIRQDIIHDILLMIPDFGIQDLTVQSYITALYWNDIERMIDVMYNGEKSLFLD